MKPVRSKMAVILSSLFLVSCGGTGQDEGSVNNNTSTISGVGIDGYLANATVCMDTNENDQCDSWEPTTTTDNDGKFSFTTAISAKNAVIRIKGGYDAQTNEPFVGQISTRVDVQNGQGVSGTVITPITTILTHADTAAKRQELMSALSVTEADLKIDYLDSASDGSANVDEILLKKAILIHSVSKYLADQLEDQYTDMGEEDSADNATGLVYQALANVMLDNNSTDLYTTLTDSALLSKVLEKAEDKVIIEYGNAELTLPARITAGGGIVPQSDTGAARAVELAKSIAESINTVFDTAGGNVSVLEASSGVRSIEVLLQKALEEVKGQEDASITSYTSLLMDNTKLDQLLVELQKPAFDVASLVENQDFSNIETVKGLAVIADSATLLTSLTGKSILVDDPDNADSSKNKHARLELYFGGAAGATSGALTACIRYIEGDASKLPNSTSDSDLDDGDTRGAYVKGSWKKFGDYATLLSLKITDNGQPYEAIIKSAGNKDSKKVFRFDFGDKLENWTSTSGLTTAPSDKPTSDEGCRTRFNNVLSS